MKKNTNVLPTPVQFNIMGQWTSWSHPEHIFFWTVGKLGGIPSVVITSLCGFGFGDSKYVQLEEQLAIYLYMSITGLNIWHTGECFQCPNETISKYFCQMLRIFSPEPIYTAYINCPNMDTPPSQKIHLNPKMWPFFQCALGTLYGTHISWCPRTVYLCVISTSNVHSVTPGGKDLWQMHRC